jgi:uncharacterized membrane protein
MKRIIFKNNSAQKIYDDYLKRVSRCISILSQGDQLDVMMEVNSHIYEATQQASNENEIDALLDALDKLGPPEIVLEPIVADKKRYQAAHSFNPKHVAQALYLNMLRGFGFFIIGIIYLFTFASVSLIILKLIYPANTGLYIGAGHFFFGYSSNPHNTASERLGNWFILSVTGLIFLFYFLNTLLLRLLKRE